MNVEEARRRVLAVPHWHHTFDIADGVRSSGTYDPTPILDWLALPADLSGVRVLDVGPSDGFFSMHLALRGAAVTAVDYRAKDAHGFGVMEAITGLKFEYHQMNVFEMTVDKLGSFDLVLFLGVLYHLPDMFRALDILRQLCRQTMYIETEHEPDLEPGTAVARYYEAATLANDHTNFWSPNRECVEAMLRDSAFTSVRSRVSGRRLLLESRIAGEGRSWKAQVAYGIAPTRNKRAIPPIT